MPSRFRISATTAATFICVAPGLWRPASALRMILRANLTASRAAAYTPRMPNCGSGRRRSERGVRTADDRLALLGTSYPATAVALRGFDVVTCRLGVQLLGAGALLVQAMWCRRPLGIARRLWPDLVFVAFLYMTIMPLGMNLGVALAGPGRTAILVYTMPIWASLFARLLLGE